MFIDLIFCVPVVFYMLVDSLVTCRMRINYVVTRCNSAIQ